MPTKIVLTPIGGGQPLFLFKPDATPGSAHVVLDQIRKALEARKSWTFGKGEDRLLVPYGFLSQCTIKAYEYVPIDLSMVTKDTIDRMKGFGTSEGGSK